MTWKTGIERLERLITERPSTGNTDLYDVDFTVRTKVLDVSRIELDKDHKVYDLLEKLPDMTEFPLIIGREEYEYPLPYEVVEKDQEEYYA